MVPILEMSATKTENLWIDGFYLGDKPANLWLDGSYPGDECHQKRISED